MSRTDATLRVARAAGGRRLRLAGLLAGGLIVGLAGLMAGPASAQEVGCPEALDAAATRYGVPVELMLAVGRVESGLSPFAINAAGIAHFAENAESAIAFVEAQRSAGVRSIDVGCGQVNLAWHPDAFADLESAFDPETNADYAAAFLSELHDRTGTWRQAAAHYHSTTPALQDAYLARVDAALRSIAGGEMPAYFASIAPAAGPGPAGADTAPSAGGVLIRLAGSAPAVRVFSARRSDTATDDGRAAGAVPRIIRVGD